MRLLVLSLLAASIWVYPLPGQAARTCKVYDACKMLLPGEVSAEVNATYAAGIEGPNFEETAGSAEGKTCEYRGGRTEPKVRLMVRCSSIGDNTPDLVRTAMNSMYKNVTDVPGVGDQALWGFDPSLGGQLNVFVGKGLYFNVSFRQKGGGAEAALAHAKALAALVVPRL